MILIRKLPIMQCGKYGEYLLEDKTMMQVEKQLAASDTTAELEIIRFAA